MLPAGKFGVSVDYLLGRTDNPKETAMIPWVQVYSNLRQQLDALKEDWRCTK